MKISTKGEYGIRAMLYLASRASEEPVTSHEIARHQGIPEPYLRQILASLSKHRLVLSHRGPQGGHSLARPPEQINLRDILLVLEGQVTSIDQILALPCTIDVGTEHCVLREVFLDVKRAVEAILVGTTLRDLAQRQEEILEGHICIPHDLAGGRELLRVLRE